MGNVFYNAGEEDKKIDPSHEMGEWESSIVSISSTSRFGRIRSCNKCEHEQAETVAGRAMHEELTRKCYG